MFVLRSHRDERPDANQSMLRQCCKPALRTPPWQACTAACCAAVGGARSISTGPAKPFAKAVSHAKGCACTSCSGPAGRPIDHRQIASAAAAKASRPLMLMRRRVGLSRRTAAARSAAQAVAV